MLYIDYNISCIIFGDNIYVGDNIYDTIYNGGDVNSFVLSDSSRGQ